MPLRILYSRLQHQCPEVRHPACPTIEEMPGIMLSKVELCLSLRIIFLEAEIPSQFVVIIEPFNFKPIDL